MLKRITFFAAAVIIAAFFSGCLHGSAAHPDPTEPPAEPGWHQTEEETCYIREDGTKATGWLEENGKRYYLRADGSLVTGWLELDGVRYYLDDTGAAVSGVVEVDGNRYIFDRSGMVASGWTEIDGVRFYADENGHPATGWLELEDGRFYLDEHGAAVTGWLELDGKQYYLTEDGSAATGRYTVDGTEHHFAFNGEKILLVNPWTMMPEDYTVELTGIGSGHKVASYAYEDFREMMDDCKDAGMRPVVRSSYRTQETQEYLYARRIRRFEAKGYSKEEATELAGTIVAIPGTSEHQLGLALDIVDARNTALDESQADMPTQQWLMENSWQYGWILRYPDDKSDATGIIYEPWHYRYVGREIAADIHETGLCLEEYLDALTK